MKKALVIVLAAVFVCICVAGVYFISRNYKNKQTSFVFSERNPSPPPNIRIYSPHLNDGYPINAYVPIRVSSASQTRIMALELWIDGQLFAAREDLATNDLNLVTGEWYWQPATPGAHSLFIRSVDANGQTGYSEIIQVNATEETKTVQLVVPQPGQTLADITTANNVDPAETTKLNPNIDPSQPLQPEQYVFIPNEPDPVILVDLSKIMASEFSVIETPPEVPGGLVSLLPLKLAQQFGLLGQQTASSLPSAPTLVKSERQGNCDVYLEFKDNSNSEDGFRIYRAAPGQSSFNKVAELPPLITKNIIYTEKALSIKGKWTYYAAAYNNYGETQSLPITIDISDPGCFPPTPEPVVNSALARNTEFGEILDIGKIVTDEPVDMAYVYLNINGQTWRLPDNINTYLQGSGYEFDLTEYMLANINKLPKVPKYNIAVELWGWKNNKPELVQKYTKEITDFTMLYGCLVTPSEPCDSDYSLWTQNVVINPGDDQDNLHIRLKVIALRDSQAYSFEFFDEPYYPPNGTYSDLEKYYFTEITDTNNYPGTQPFYIDENLGEMFSNNPEFYGNTCTGEAACTSKAFYQRYQGGEPFSAYYQVTPIGLTQEEYPYFPSLATSNRVYIRRGTQAPPEQEVPQTPRLPDIYSVEFLEDTYTPAKPADPSLWGCIMYLEDYPNHPKGSIECPPIYNDPCASQFSFSCAGNILTGEFDMVKDGYDWLAAKAGEASAWLVKQIAGVIPGCDGSDACKWVIKKVVEITWTYLTGLPPDLPNSDALVDEGLNYIVSYAVDETAASILNNSGATDAFNEALPEDAQKYILDQTDTLKQQIVDQVKNRWLEYHRGRSGNDSESCLYPEIAKSKGREPLCPNPAYAWQPWPGSDITTPTIQVKITRKLPEENSNYNTDAYNVYPADGVNYALRITNVTINSNRAGQFIPMRGGYVENYPEDACDLMLGAYKDSRPGYPTILYGGYGGNIAYPCWFRVDQQMVGSLYPDILMSIPWIEPGNSIVLNLSFKRNDYWYGNHQSKIYEIGGDPEMWAAGVGDDWLYLYFFGETIFRAKTVCTSNTPEKVFCGSEDFYFPVVPTP